MLRHLALLVVLMLGLFLASCADREIEIKPRGQMVIGGSVSGSTTR